MGYYYLDKNHLDQLFYTTSKRNLLYYVFIGLCRHTLAMIDCHHKAKNYKL
jgi:hypothetical protein